MAKKKKTSKKTASLKTVHRRADVPATHGQIESLRSELKSDVASLTLKMESRFKLVDARFKDIDARFDKVDARFKEVDARFDKVDSSMKEIKSSIEKVLSAVHNIHAVVEEQNARNRFVFDGLMSVIDVQNNLSARISKLEKTTFSIESWI